MQIGEFAGYAYESANAYLEYLKRANKGKEVIRVTKIVKREERFVLSLEKRPPFPDALKMKINNLQFPVNLKGIITIVCFTDVPASVIIKVKNEYFDKFCELEPQDITFESNFLFIVEAVKEWYREHADKIEKPKKTERVKFFASDVNQITESQSSAINTALTSDVSYIWGAPGTGKTQYVLSNCIMAYVRAGKKVLLMAPTNNALEQSLRGIIRVFKENNLPTNYIVRLGNPTLSFAQENPEVCLSTAPEAKIKRLKDEIEALKKENAAQMEYALVKRNFERYCGLSTVYEELEAGLRNLMLEKQNVEIQRDFLNKEIEEAKNQLNVKRGEIKLLTKKQRSFFTKIKIVFHRAVKVELEQKIIDASNEVSAIDIAVGNLMKELQQREEQYKAIKKSIERDTKEKDVIYQEMISLSPEKGKAVGVSAITEAFKNYFTAHIGIVVDETITNSIQQKQEELDLCLNRQKVDLIERYIVACTVDYAHLHYGEFPQEIDEKAEHLFVDEAAYCPMIKAGVFFSYGIPVTFLGDHMQLPPICEMRENEVRESKTYAFLWAQSSMYFPEIFNGSSTIEGITHRFLKNQPIDNSNVNVASLEETHRFGDNLARILNRFVYRFGFKGVSDEETKITVVNVPRNPMGEDGLVNSDEVMAIKKYLNKYQPDKNSVAILSPYRRQVAALKKALGYGMDISTIHASQGREWDTVIVSVVESNNKFFMDSTNVNCNGLKIINTAISRAKKELVLVLDYEHWKYCYTEQLIGNIAVNNTKYLESSEL